MQEKNDMQDRFLVGIGASAGGLEAIRAVLSTLPHDTDTISYIIAQHLSPSHKSKLVEILRRSTDMPIHEAYNEQQIENNNIYITPPDSNVRVDKEKLYLEKPSKYGIPKPSVNLLFESMAETWGNRSIGIILSGTGSDGSEGIRSIRESGGFTIVQEPNSAKYNGMPNSAIQSHNADYILNPSEIGERIREIIFDPENSHSDTLEVESDADAIEIIYQLLSDHGKVDISQYKSTMLLRRIDRRMQKLKIRKISSYIKHIEEHPDEIDALFESALIGVTSFFRDTDTFQVLEDYFISIFERKQPGDFLRIWIPGCATGEEVYSIAIMIAQLLRDNIGKYKIHIFATDINENAVSYARQGIYTEKAIQELPEDYVNQYFTKLDDGRYEINKLLRSMVLFSKHDLLTNPPFLNLDVISCRNLLIYLTNETQRQLFPMFHYALVQDGILFLGKSETIGQFTDLFSTIDAKAKIFQRKRGGLRAKRFHAFKPQLSVERTVEKRKKRQKTIDDLVKESLFDNFEYPYIVINDNLDIQSITGDVNLFMKLKSGEMNANIISLADEQISIDLRSVISRAMKEQHEIRTMKKQFKSKDSVCDLEILCRPINSSEDSSTYYLIIFDYTFINEVSDEKTSELDVDAAHERIKDLENELRTNQEYLQTFIEELETSNEELQALNEELQSSNEELQSSNEELETSNEELQSTNEEAQIAYVELKSSYELLEQQDHQLRQLENDLWSLINATEQVFFLLDKDFNILIFNDEAQRFIDKIFGKNLSQKNSFAEFFQNEDFQPLFKPLKKAFTEKVVSLRLTLHDKTGRELPVDVQMNPVPDFKTKQAVALIINQIKKKTEN